MNITTRITSILRQSMVLQIATSAQSIPWICTVCFAYDKDFNLYWFSRLSARHSKEILINPTVAGAVSVPYVFGEKPQGLQFAGNAEKVQDEKSILQGLSVLQKRFGVKQKRIAELKKELLSEAVDYGLYRLVPHEIVLYDTKHFSREPRHAYVPMKESR